MSCTIVHTQDHIDENFVPRIHIVPYKLFGKHPRKRPLDIELHMLKHKLEHMLELDDNTVEYIADHMEGYNCS